MILARGWVEHTVKPVTHIHMSPNFSQTQLLDILVVGLKELESTGATPNHHLYLKSQLDGLVLLLTLSLWMGRERNHEKKGGDRREDTEGAKMSGRLSTSMQRAGWTGQHKDPEITQGRVQSQICTGTTFMLNTWADHNMVLSKERHSCHSPRLGTL